MRLKTLLPIAFGLAAMLAGGCETNNVSFFIAGNVIPQPGGMGGVCQLDSGGTLLTPNGTFNIDTPAGVARSYEVFPLYVNQLQGSRSPLGADPNGITVRAAEVELRNSAGEAIGFGGGLPNPFSVSTSTFVPSGSEQVGGIVVIPNAYRAALSAGASGGSTIVAAVKLRVETNGDNNITTEPWLWPIDLCTGNCLFQCDDTGMGSGGETTCCTPGQDTTCVQTPPDC